MKSAATPRPPTPAPLCGNPRRPLRNQIEAMKPDLVALVGDLQYQVGQYSDFEQSFDLTYGALNSSIGPRPATTSFMTSMAQTGVAGYGYFSYLQRLPDRCQMELNRRLRSRTRAHRHCRDMQLSGPYHSHSATRSAAGWTGGALRVGRTERTPGGQSESAMAGTPIIWVRGTLSRSISSARRSRAAVRPRAPGLPPNSNG